MINFLMGFVNNLSHLRFQIVIQAIGYLAAQKSFGFLVRFYEIRRLCSLFIILQ